MHNAGRHAASDTFDRASTRAMRTPLNNIAVPVQQKLGEVPLDVSKQHAALLLLHEGVHWVSCSNAHTSFSQSIRTTVTSRTCVPLQVVSHKAKPAQWTNSKGCKSAGMSLECKPVELQVWRLSLKHGWPPPHCACMLPFPHVSSGSRSVARMTDLFMHAYKGQGKP